MRDPSSSIRARFAAENAFVLVPVLAMLAAASHRKKKNRMTIIDLQPAQQLAFSFPFFFWLCTSSITASPSNIFFGGEMGTGWIHDEGRGDVGMAWSPVVERKRNRAKGR